MSSPYEVLNDGSEDFNESRYWQCSLCLDYVPKCVTHWCTKIRDVANEVGIEL